MDKSDGSFPPSLFAATRASFPWMVPALLLLSCIVAAFTQPYFWADTLCYADDILKHEGGQFSLGADPLWEFGHLFWRPLGYLLHQFEGEHVAGRFTDVPHLRVSVLLVAASTLSYVAGTVLAYLLSLRVSASRWGAFWAALSFLFAHGILNYAQTGTAYVSGLTIQLLGLYILTRSRVSSRDYFIIIATCLCWAVSVCIWFPYIVSIPALLFFAFWWIDKAGNGLHGLSKKSLKPVIIMCLVSFSVATSSYGIALRSRGIDSFNKLESWVLSSGHGVNSPRKHLHLVTGIPKAFFYFEPQSGLLKRFMLNDTYECPNLRAVIEFLVFRSSMVWKIAGTLIFVLAICFILWKDASARPLLFALALAFLGNLCFALFFEPSQPERWLPCYSLLLPSIAVAFRNASLPGRVIVIVFIAAVGGVNLQAMSQTNVRRLYAAGIERAQTIDKNIQLPSQVIVLNLWDDVARAVWDMPFHEVSQKFGHRVYPPCVTAAPFIIAVDPNRLEAPLWGNELDQRLTVAWEQNEDVWLSRRLLASRPKPEWRWVEGDDPRISWADFPRFFATLELGQSFGGEDGFVLILPNEANKRRLKDLAAGQLQLNK